MSTTRIVRKTSVQENSKSAGHAEKERYFELSLPTYVRGIDAYGSPFEERTNLISISAEKATFWLETKVTIGTSINLSLDIPKTVVLENHLNLLVSGEIIYIQSDKGLNKSQLISIRLDKTFKINSSS